MAQTVCGKDRRRLERYLVGDTLKMNATIWSIFGLGVGFVVGFGIGQSTRQATSSNITSDFSGGVVTIKANVGNALKEGLSDYVSNF